MGANYDVIVTAADDGDSHIECISSFLTSRGFMINLLCPLESADIPNTSAVLIGPLRNGRVQLVADSSAMKIGLQEWFDDNPVAKYLSSRMAFAIHLWSLDSGFVVGYTGYSNGARNDCECLFSEKAKNRDQIIDGVVTPVTTGGHTLADVLGDGGFTFSTNVSGFHNLEVGLANLVSRLGFGEHLVDFYDAVDDKIGIALEGNHYSSVTLSEWRALLFRKA